METTYDARVYVGTDPQWVQLGLPKLVGAEAWLEIMDSAGIGGALLAPAHTSIADDFSQELDLIAAGVRLYPKRLFGMCRVRPKIMQASVAALRRSVEELGFKALLFHTMDDDYSLTERTIIDPIIEVAGTLGIPVVFDALDTSWSSCTPSMVADIAADFPEITFVIGRMGFGGVNGWPGHPTELLPALQRAPNTVADTASVFHCKFIQDTVDAVGSERVMMGSGAPYVPIELSKIMFTKHMNKLDQRQKDQITGGNLARILGIE